MDGEETFLFLSNRRDRETNPELYSVKGSGVNHYPSLPPPPLTQQIQYVHSNNVGLMLGLCRRKWLKIKTKLGVFALLAQCR